MFFGPITIYGKKLENRIWSGPPPPSFQIFGFGSRPLSFQAAGAVEVVFVFERFLYWDAACLRNCPWPMYFSLSQDKTRSSF